ncbi:MAG TPA: Gfo/Idh/MocA family oxidoreductase [Planctomycetota bacterium]|nr:Gfo/Idh/MocA family oxidoreductase [Planctomycetota bacterium]
MAYKMIQVGTGGFGGWWCRHFLPPNVADGHVEVVAVVDKNPDAFVNAREGLGLREDQCYTDLKKALDENKADFCTVVVPPAFHEMVVDAALDHGLHVLSEKPIADTMDAAVRISKKVRNAGRKMGVTMSHRFAHDKDTFRALLRSGELGRLDYIVCRFTCDCRAFGSWGKFRHEIPDPLMVEGAVHHLDILNDFAGAKCDSLYAQTWNAPWGEFAGDSNALVTMHHENGVRTFYEGAKTNASTMNGWTNEYFRAECELATLELDTQAIRIKWHPSVRPNPDWEPVPLRQQPKWMNAWLIEKFCRWLEGGEPMETNVWDNLQSVALIFSAIQSARTGKPVEVQKFLKKAVRTVKT